VLGKGKANEAAKAAEKSQKAIEGLYEDDMADKVILSLALPSEPLLYKMMRACVAVKTPEGLWFEAGPSFSTSSVSPRSPEAP